MSEKVAKVLKKYAKKKNVAVTELQLEWSKLNHRERGKRRATIEKLVEVGARKKARRERIAAQAAK